VKKLLPVALVPVLALWFAPPAGAAFDLGVTAGEVTPRSAILWAHATRAGRVRVELARNRGFGLGLRGFRTRADASHDFTVHRRVARLRPNTRYFFRFLQGRRISARGSFRTAPAPRANQTIEFAWSGDADAQPLAPGGPPFWNSFQAYAAMAREGNHFNVNLGDIIYSDTEVQDANGQPVAPTALTVQAKWAKYRMNWAQRNLQRLQRAAGLYSHWDDHEIVNDFSPPEHGAEVYDAGLQAFLDYNPVRYSSSSGLYRSFRWGGNLELFLLDERSFRSAKASANGTCNNPSTGQPDFAPTAPQPVRNNFAALVPSLATPVSQECLDTINDPSRTLLGQAQRERFVNAVRASTARFKVVMNEVPIQQYYVAPYDRWEGYEAERKLIVEALQQEPGVVFLSTDVHANFVNTIKFDTLGPGPTRDSGIFDVTTGPVATATFQREIDRATGEGNGAQADALFFEGFMRCSEIDTFSYGQVSVTSRELTVRLKDANGAPLVNKSTGEQCDPVVVEAD
jgi:alkaline phosphatase D